MCVWLSFQIKEDLFVALILTFYVNYKRLLHLMAIFLSVSDSTRVLALCQVCLEAFSLCEAAAQKFDVI